MKQMVQQFRMAEQSVRAHQRHRQFLLPSLLVLALLMAVQSDSTLFLS